MRSLILMGAAIAGLATIAAAPAIASGYAQSLRLLPSRGHIFPLCIAPAQLENVCTAWGPAGPGQLFGPCLKSQLKCVTPPNIQ